MIVVRTAFELMQSFVMFSLYRKSSNVVFMKLWYLKIGWSLSFSTVSKLPATKLRQPYVLKYLIILYRRANKWRSMPSESRVMRGDGQTAKEISKPLRVRSLRFCHIMHPQLRSLCFCLQCAGLLLLFSFIVV